MAMTLDEESRPARMSLTGTETVLVPAGKHVKIETSPSGVEILDAVVPAGKAWTVTVNVYIVETDV